MTVSFSYTPGSATAIVGARCLALVELAPDHELVGGVAGVVTAGGSADDVLEVLLSLGLRVVPSFAVAEFSDAGVRVVVRGDLRAEASGVEPVTGGGVWVDRFLSGATAVSLVGPQGASSVTLPLLGGVVLAARVDAAAASPAARHSGNVSTNAFGDVDSSTNLSVGAPGAAAQPSESVPAEPETPDFDHLFGATREPADLPVPPDAPPAGQTLPSPLTAPVRLPTPEEPVPQVRPPAPVKPGATFIDALPWNPDGSPLTPPPGSPRPALPEAEPEASGPSSPPAAPMTIDRAQLREHGGATGPTVVAARCPQGHLSPAYAGTCRVCRQPLAAQQPFEVPRPPLGVLRLQNGDTVLLDRGVILGRNPRLPQGWTGEQPHVVKIHDPERDVSSQHLEVRLDFWHVLVRDLGSTNGTVVTLPGAEPVALRAHDPLAIEPGTRVRLADVFDITFEVTP